MMSKTAQRRPRKTGSISTIEDVAQLAGVSTATVSRYLNNPDIVTKKSGVKVQAAIAELSYIPNALAGSLASSSNSQAVAIFVPYLADSLINDTIDKLIESFMAAGTMPFLGVTGFDSERNNNALLAALGRRVSALVTTGPIEEPVRNILRATKTTTIQTWGLAPDPFDLAIGFSHIDVGDALARFAHEHGYRRPHLLTASGLRARWRRQGFAAAWSKLSKTPITDDEVPIPTHYGHAPAAFAHIMQLDQRPDIIITGTDQMAHGIILEAQSAGLSVPEDLAVVGFGDMRLASHVTPSITTVRINGARIADKILEVIQDRRDGIEPESNRIDCGFEIIRRDSA